jgi:excisionase family DNA binding protein
MSFDTSFGPATAHKPVVLTQQLYGDRMAVMSVTEAAAKSGLHVETIRRWARSGVLKTQRIGRVYVIDERDLRRVLANPPKPTGRPRKADRG